ncbi:expressed protein [Arabidopsis lyrata subsp. lyrata]|uniref:Expressed protein n=1 Tax=Arabidopsis lyrata subsp. lyrata TaxID=81972 RepID=D7LTJ6_ARALL|nr:expressed protein [Arabidopsis lyrata subsp. lyrata]
MSAEVENRCFCGGVAWVTGDDDPGRMDGKMLDGLSSITVNDEAVVYTLVDTKGIQRRLFIWMRRWWWTLRGRLLWRR